MTATGELDNGPAFGGPPVATIAGCRVFRRRMAPLYHDMLYDMTGRSILVCMFVTVLTQVHQEPCDSYGFGARRMA